MNDEKNALDRILVILSSIDERIMLLHQCSSDDFLSLNTALKENYKKASFITTQAGQAFEQIGEKGNVQTLELLKQNFDVLKQDIIEFEFQTDSTLASLERIQSNFSLMFVPINNFRQNLISLRLLLSNIKLTNTYFDKSIQSFNEKEAFQIESVINKVKESCPVFEENIFNIQKFVKSLYLELSSIKEKVLAELVKNLEVMQVDFELLCKHNQNILKNRDRLTEISGNCNSSVDSIITNLQYHDIIRQKMEHIQKTHCILKKEISINTTRTDRQTSSELLQIPQIAEIQVGQLIHTNKEYQQAIEQISKKLIEIGKDTTEVVRICKVLSRFDYRENMTEYGVFNDSFQTSVSNIPAGLGRYSRLCDEVSLVNTTLTHLFHKYQDIDMMESAVEQRIIDKISFSNLLISPEKETASQAQQILKLYADNHFEKNKIRTLFENTRVELREIIFRNLDFVNDRRIIDRLNSNILSAMDQFDEIRQNFEYFDMIHADLAQKSNDINSMNKMALEGVKYYASSEKAIEELIVKFGQITDLMKGADTSDSEASSVNILEHIERYYTMKSERIVHNHSISQFARDKTIHSSIIQLLKEVSAEKGNDVEFF